MSPFPSRGSGAADSSRVPFDSAYYRHYLVFHPIAEADKYGDFNAAEDFIQSRFV